MKKIISMVLAVAMLMGLNTLSIASATTDSVKTVIVDTSGYTQYAASWNRVTQGAQINCTGVTAVSGIGDDPNVCVRFQVNPTDDGANKGVGRVSRFATSKCNADGSFGGIVSPADATTPVFWSVDVWSGSDVDYVQMTLQGAAMSPQLVMSDLVAGKWNTLSVVYYPAAYLNTEKGSADFYLNGEYVDSYSNLSATATEYRLLFMFNAANEYFYIDNLKLYEMTSFTRPYLDTTDLPLSDGMITGCIGMNVAEAETMLGATVYNADGTEADDSAQVTADMVVAEKVTITGVGTFTDTYKFHPVAEKLVDTSGYTQYAASWNRVTQGAQINCTGVTAVSGIGDDPNVCARFQVNPTDDGANKGVGRVSRFATSKCNDDGTFGGIVSPADATAPMYWSVDVWSGSDVDYVQMTLLGAAMSPQLAMSDLVANDWNNLAVVYYPASYLGTEKSTADFYLNGEYVKSYTGLSAEATEYRLLFMFNAADEYFYIDNVKLYEMASFDKPLPEVSDSSITLTDGVFTGYGTVTVSQMESKLGVSVLNADGTTPDGASTVKAGMKAVFSSTVAGVGTFTSTCTFGLADKVLIGEDFTSTTSYTSVLSNRIGFSHTREAGQIGGKASDDGYLKITTANQDDGSDGTKDCRFAVGSEYTTDGSSGRLSPAHGDPLIYSIDVYPAAGMKSIQFDSGTYAWSAQIDAKALNQGEWNNITFVFYTTKFSPEIAETLTWESDIYVNGTLYSRAHSDYMIPKVSNELRFHIITAATGDVTYIDNICVVSAGSFVRPELSSDSCTVTESKIDKATVSGYKGMTVSELKESVAASDESVTVTVYSSNDTVADDADEAEAGMYMLAEVDLSGDEYGAIARKYARKYVLESVDFLVNAPIGYANGYADNKFGKGTYTVDTLIDCYASEVNMTATLAQLDSDGEEIKSNTTDTSLTETATVSVALDITETQDTYLVYTLKNKTTDEVLLTKTIKPYDMTVIEKAVILSTTTDGVEIGDYSVKNNSDATVNMHINGESVTLEAGEEYVTEPRIFVEFGADKTARIYSNNAYGTIVAASYADNGALIEASEGESEAELSYDGVSKVRGMLLKSLSSLRPLTKSLDINIKTPDIPTIACWGDSLTYGYGSTDNATKSYPAVLSSLTGGIVYNMGIGGETATTIAARQGVLDIVTTEDFVIPAEGIVDIAFMGSNGGTVVPRNVNLAGWTPCEIAGVKGTLSAGIYGPSGKQYLAYATFTRSEKGTPVKVKAGERIAVAAHDVIGDINVIFSGTNGGWSDTNESATTSMSSANRASEIKSLVDLLEKQGKKSKNPDKYIILGIARGTKSDWQDLTDSMSERFGDKFIDIRSELSKEEVLIEAGITPTTEDLTAIANGEVPPSLRTDELHFTDAGYKKIAELIYDKLKELGYII